MDKDLNKSKEFYEWIDKTFNFVDNGVKKLLFKAWCARGKVERNLTPHLPIKGEE